MILAISVEPTAEPVTVEELKQWARLDHNDLDDTIHGLLRA